MQLADNAGPDQPASLPAYRINTVVYVDKQRMLTSDCMDLGLCCSHMAKGIFFPHWASHVITNFSVHFFRQK